MKRLFCILLILALLPLTSSAVTWGTTSLNEGETAAYALSLILGEGSIVSFDKVNEYDEINSRFVFIVDGSTIIMLIRTSNSEACLWTAEFDAYNWIMAKTILDEDAPMCVVSYSQNDETLATAFYIKSLSSVLTYEKFTEDVDNILNMVSNNTLANSSAIGDPFLAAFPGINWDMTKDDMLNSYGDSSFYNADTVLITTKKVNTDDVDFTFVFQDNDLSQIMIMVPLEKNSEYLNLLSSIYGNPIKTTLISALSPFPQEDPNGDTYMWKSSSLLITFSGSLLTYYQRP